MEEVKDEVKAKEEKEYAWVIDNETEFIEHLFIANEDWKQK